MTDVCGRRMYEKEENRRVKDYVACVGGEGIDGER